MTDWSGFLRELKRQASQSRHKWWAACNWLLVHDHADDADEMFAEFADKWVQ